MNIYERGAPLPSLEALRALRAIIPSNPLSSSEEERKKERKKERKISLECQMGKKCKKSKKKTKKGAPFILFPLSVAFFLLLLSHVAL